MSTWHAWVKSPHPEVLHMLTKLGGEKVQKDRVGAQKKIERGREERTGEKQQKKKEMSNLSIGVSTCLITLRAT